MAGRRPKPLAIHKLNGNPRHFSQAELHGHNNPQPKLQPPEMPKGMTKGARREWKRIVPLLIEVGVLSKIDGLALAAYCRSAAMVEELDKEIAASGYTFREMYENKDGQMVPGNIKPNPAVSQYMSAMKLMKAFLIEFGLTPASRTRLKIEKPTDDDEMEDMLAGRTSTPDVPILIPQIDPSEMIEDDTTPEEQIEKEPEEE